MCISIFQVSEIYDDMILSDIQYLENVSFGIEI